MCIDIVEIANGQILSNFDGVICQDTPLFFWGGGDDDLSKCQRILTRLGTCTYF